MPVKRLAVLGFPVAHSRSPAMQSAALAELGLGGEWSYEAIEVAPVEFVERTAALADEGFVGANVTIPHKRAALELAGDASASAAEIGAANTLSFRGGEVRADNTDAPGLLAALPTSPAGMRALVLGAGGSARAAAWALAREGAAADVWNRTPERAVELVESLTQTSAGAGGELGAVSAERARAGGYDLVVNCTAVGMGGAEDPFEQLPLLPRSLGEGVVLVDLVYVGGETRLLAAGRRQGARTVGGLEVLVRQGAESLRIWTGHELTPPVLEAMRAAAAGAG